MNRKDLFIFIAFLAAHATCAEAKGDDDKQAVDVFLNDPEGFDKSRMVQIAAKMHYKALVRDYADKELWPDFPGSEASTGSDMVQSILKDVIPLLPKMLLPK